MDTFKVDSYTQLANVGIIGGITIWWEFSDYYLANAYDQELLNTHVYQINESPYDAIVWRL